VTSAAATTMRRLRPRGHGAAQPITSAELFFDLVYVFAVTQLSHQIIDDLSAAGVARAGVLLLVVWWAWIYTTWMANWFDPASPAVRTVLTAVMLASLLMAAARPRRSVSGDCCSPEATSRCRSAATPRPCGCSSPATDYAACSSDWSSGVPYPA
jgi:hypothetical protein